MDVYNIPEHGHTDAYMIQGTTDSNLQLTSPFIEPLETMYNEGAPEFVAEQGLYYPPASNYGYICTGFESPGDWDDHHRVFGMDGQNIQFIGTQTESYPYVYYTPSYGYAQSTYNPYNPYIPGAMIGADGSFVGPQQYYLSSYENGASSPAYFPMAVQSGPDTFTGSTAEQFVDMSASYAKSVDASGFNRNSASAAFTSDQGRVGSNHINPFGRVSESFKSNGGPNRFPATNGSVTSNNISGPASSQILQGRGAQGIENLSNGKTFSHHNQLNVALPSSNGTANFGSSGNDRMFMDKIRSKVPFGRITNDINRSSDVTTVQNQGPRTTVSKNQLTVKAHSNRAGNSDAQGNITIYMDQYNKDDFPLEYANAKFFVIKSYSEDDVHKSIKYNVWSSTPNGNRKLNNAYEDAKKMVLGSSNGCPVFLFFSVNASGQFCGVAEMTGHVDFHKDMDFWQQDKWSGNFPVKWHIIKDVTNPNFRHIILENNEHKPVTNSRDTQEITYKKGIEMLKVFKNHASKTSLLDDFMYYENRQKILHEEKAKLLTKSYGTPVFVPVINPPRKLSSFFDVPSSGDDKSTKQNDLDTSRNKIAVTPSKQKTLDGDVLDQNGAKNDPKQEVNGNSSEGDALQIGSLTITTKPLEPKPVEPAGSAEPGTVLTVGSMVVVVNGPSESSGLPTVGTIPLDPQALKVNKPRVSTNLARTEYPKG